MTFHETLKSLRKSKNISQVQLADKLKVSPGLIGMYETGSRKPSYEMLEALADFFNVDIGYLTGREDKSTYILRPEDITTKDEKELLRLYRALNDEGKEISINMLLGLSASGQYKKHNPSRMVEEKA